MERKPLSVLDWPAACPQTAAAAAFRASTADARAAEDFDLPGPGADFTPPVRPNSIDLNPAGGDIKYVK